jgi:hypothetical protein
MPPAKLLSERLAAPVAAPVQSDWKDVDDAVSLTLPSGAHEGLSGMFGSFGTSDKSKGTADDVYSKFAI